MSHRHTPSDRARAGIEAVIDDLFGLPPEALEPSLSLQDGLQLDSLSVVELQVAVEDSFDIRFTESDTADVTTIGDLVAAVESALERRRQAS